MALQENSRISQWAAKVDEILRTQGMQLYDGGSGNIVLPIQAGGSWLTSSMIMVTQTGIPGLPKYIRVWPFAINYTSDLPHPETFVSLVMQKFPDKSKLIKEGDVIPTGTRIEELVQ